MPREKPPEGDDGAAQSKLYLLRPEADALVQEAVIASDFRDAAMLCLGFDTGQRVQDLMLGVWAKDIDLEARIIRRVFDHKKDRWREGIPFSPQGAKLTAAYLKNWATWHETAKPRAEDHLFGLSPQWARERLKEWMRKAVVDRETVWETLQRRAENTGIKNPRFGWHLCRHTYCRLLLKEHGDNPRTWKIMSQVTGDRISTLMETYSDFSGEDIGEMVFGREKK